MNKLIRSKFFMIMLLVALILVIVPSVLSLMGLSNYVQGALRVLFTPAQTVMMKITDAAEGFTEYFTAFDDMKKENVQLKKDIAELEEKLYRTAELEEMNSWLYEYLELAREHTDYTLEPADIVGYDPGNYMTVFTLNKGTSSGIAANMPVITPGGIVGYVKEAGTNWAKVLTMIEASSAVGAYVERSGELGLIEGGYDLRTNNLCRFIYLSSSADIQVGDRILSSGLGSIYPRGLVVGTVESIEADEFRRTFTAYVRPKFSLEEISRVMVIKSYETYTE